MRVRQLIALFIALSLSTTAVASFKQRVIICLTVMGNVTGYDFHAQFSSSDFFDSYKVTGYVENGQRCVMHNYNHGPKNVKLGVRLNQIRRRGGDISISLDRSCYFMRHQARSWITSDYQGTHYANEEWHFSLMPYASDTNFLLTCEHIAY